MEQLIQVDQIIHAQWIASGEPGQPELKNHALVIKNNLIKDILSSDQANKKYQTSEVELLPNHILIPGFVNCHTHLAMNYFRGLADDTSLMDWLKNYIWPAEKTWLSEEFVKDASLFAMAEMIRSGTTCFNDMYFFLQSTAEAAITSGMRSAIGMTIINFPSAWAKDTDDYFQKGLEFYQQYKDHPLITITIAPHAIYTVPEKYLLKVKKIAEEYHLKINMHVQETAEEVNQSLKEFNLRPLKRLEQIGLLSSDLIAIHMTQMNEEDLELLQKYKPNIVHCPQSNMKLASGTCPVSQLQALGLNIALGTDSSASNNDLDMIDEMRSASFLAKLTTGKPTCLSAAECLTMASLNGAKALGIAHITGSLQIGKAADMTAIQLDEIETLPLYHPISQVVYAAGRNQVSDVWAAGKRLLKNRQLVTLDENALKDKAKYWGKKIFQL